MILKANFIFTLQSMFCGYSLEQLRQGSSNEYLLLRNKENHCLNYQQIPTLSIHDVVMN